MNKEKARAEILKLVEKFKNDNQAFAANEEAIKQAYILPLFKILGWDSENLSEVYPEANIKGHGRADYIFSINGRTKFYLEAKPARVDLEDPKYARQAINYSWNKGITWSVLTDFQGLKVFNTERIEKDITGMKTLDFDFENYVNDFELLWLLSKESFEKDLINQYAEKHGKKDKKIKLDITSKLFEDLREIRKDLTEKFSRWNSNLDKNILDEGVQKIIDRLIFIRVLEDKKIEDPILIPILNEYQNSTTKQSLWEYISVKFKTLDVYYNSNIFSEHTVDKWKEYDDAIKDAIKKLYGKEGYYNYDFSVIPADVLGTVYESYLGYKLSTVDSKNKKLFNNETEIEISKDAKKRKEQGIYYTPGYIVDYIAKNTLKPVLDKCNTIGDLKKIKVLDPACGSGSFLVKALELICKRYEELDHVVDEPTKLTILMENIYGVDLDPQAVELTRLNLLINAIDRRMKLPKLEHIKNGNSLISGTDEELKKYFSTNYREEKAFNWEEEFKEVFKQGGFDVIIGNPPYITTKDGKISEFEKRFYTQNFECAYDKLDLYVLFIEKSVKIIKEHGFISFITPWNFLANFYSFKIRKFILDNTKIKLLNKLPPNTFGEAIVDNIIFILEKDNNNKDNQVILDDLFDKKNQKTIKQSTYLNNEKYVFNISSNDVADKILNKMKLQSKRLGDISLNYIGIMTGDQKEMISNSPIFKNSKPVLSGKDIAKWTYVNRGNFVNFDKSKIHSNDNEKVYLSKKKILLRKTGKDLIACMDTSQFYTIQSLYNIIVKDKEYTEEYLLALLNSKLLTYIYNKFYITNPEVFPYIKRRHLDELPIKISSDNQQKILIKLSEKMLELHNELKEIHENSDKWENIKSEIEKTDKKIDQEIYELYGLNKEEVGVVENSTK